MSTDASSVTGPAWLDHYDVVVVGGGPIGLAAAYSCAREGRSVLLLEQYNFFNQSGSSNDLVRMFRTMYTESFLADLAHASIKDWHDLEHEAGEELIVMSGLLNFGDPAYIDGPEGNLLEPVKNLDRLGMPYRTMTAKEIQSEYPLEGLPSSFVGVFAPDNGCINVPRVLRVLHRLARAHGATLRSNTAVTDLGLSPDLVKVSIKESNGTERVVTGERCILAAGAYTNRLLRSFGLALRLQIWEMVYAYYATDPESGNGHFPSMWFQFLGSTDGDPAKSNLFYGFPSVSWGPENLVRIAVDNAVNIINDPAERGVAPAANDLAVTAEFVRHHCPGVDAQPNYCGTCLQANLPDNLSVLDFLPATVGPGHENVAVFAGGWAFKFVPLVGKALADLVLEGETGFWPQEFRVARPGLLQV
ncbi:MAG: FAD-dependent oxidoreductase [Solirubrobacteraceae bacterium]|jgi:sarcosine oxidase/L-pipecolate oxidase